MDRNGDWMQTYSGLRFYVMDPRPEDVVIEDIAHALAQQCRYNGHCRCFYSVAQHSVLVSMEVERRRRLTDDSSRSCGNWLEAVWGLLHDASEAYLGDMVRPLKRSMPEYRAAEQRVQLAVMQRMGKLLEHEPIEPSVVKLADTILLSTERRDLMQHQLDWNQDELCEPRPERIEPLGPEAAEQFFLGRFWDLRRLVAWQSRIDIYPMEMNNAY